MSGTCEDPAAARSAGSRHVLCAFLGFRCASPQALCYRLLRRLVENSYLALN